MVPYLEPQLHRSVPGVWCFSPGLWTTSDLTDSSDGRRPAATSLPETAALKAKATPNWKFSCWDFLGLPNKQLA